MNKHEENVYKSIFEYPTKIIAELELKNEQLEKEKEQLKHNIDKAIEILGQYKLYSTPTEEQNSENEDIVDNAYNILKR